MLEELTKEQLIEKVKQLRADNNALTAKNAKWKPLKACFVQNEKELESRIEESARTSKRWARSFNVAIHGMGTLLCQRNGAHPDRLPPVSREELARMLGDAVTASMAKEDEFEDIGRGEGEGEDW